MGKTIDPVALGLLYVENIAFFKKKTKDIYFLYIIFQGSAPALDILDVDISSLTEPIHVDEDQDHSQDNMDETEHGFLDT